MRYTASFRDHSTIPAFIQKVSDWFESWSISTDSFDDGWKPETEEMREHTISILRKDLGRLCSIVSCETGAVHLLQTPPTPLHNMKGTRAGRQSMLLASSVPPGHLRPDGPRHDNDRTDIREITIEPSEAELISTITPFLPANTPGAPHHLRTNSMERLLDIQFRLLREEFL